jgi:hypothetical protein
MYPCMYDSETAPSVEKADAISAATGNAKACLVYVGGPSLAGAPWSEDTVTQLRKDGWRTLPIFGGRQYASLENVSVADATELGISDAKTFKENLATYEYGPGATAELDYEYAAVTASVLAYFKGFTGELKADGFRPSLYSGPEQLTTVWNAGGCGFDAVHIAAWRNADDQPGRYDGNASPTGAPLNGSYWRASRSWQYASDFKVNGFTVDLSTCDPSMLTAGSAKPVGKPPVPLDAISAAWDAQREGDAGPDATRAVQALYNAWESAHESGAAPLVVDGTYGPATTTAITHFQQVEGAGKISVTGVAGPLTMNALLSYWR